MLKGSFLTQRAPSCSQRNAKKISSATFAENFATFAIRVPVRSPLKLVLNRELKRSANNSDPLAT